MKYWCHDCNKECDPIEKDDGGYEEVWGAKVWVEAFTDYCDMCDSDNVEKLQGGAQTSEIP